MKTIITFLFIALLIAIGYYFFPAKPIDPTTIKPDCFNYGEYWKDGEVHHYKCAE